LVGFVNTTYGDRRAPVPSESNSITIAPGIEDILQLNTEKVDLADVNPRLITSDTDADGLINPIDPDDDGDHIYSEYETSLAVADLDGDEIVNYLDPDDENDGIFTLYEFPDPNGDFNPNDARDTDGDGIPDYMDDDDDGDGILTINENSDPNFDGIPDDAIDSDRDGIPDYLDADDDGDGIPTLLERVEEQGQIRDTDADGILDYLDNDDDNDGIASLNEIDLQGATIEQQLIDTDGDGLPNYRDDDDDNDGVLTLDEDTNFNGNPLDDDSDGDGIIDALESSLLDSDGDGVNDELDSDNNNPYNDTDGDGFSNLDEISVGTNPNDSSDFPQDFTSLAFEITTFFSPNGDGVNDTWYEPSFDRYPVNEVWVYSPAGIEVFHTQNYRNDWTGLHGGKQVPEGSYYYLIDYNGDGTPDYKGWLYLTR
jgi:heat shock protein beta